MRDGMWALFLAIAAAAHGLLSIDLQSAYYAVWACGLSFAAGFFAVSAIRGDR